MGFMKFLSPIAMLFGAGDDDESAAPVVQQQTTSQEDEGKSQAQIEKERKQAALRANAGSNNQYNPLSAENEPASVTSKTLLGL